jgi:hypothetical protein
MNKLPTEIAPCGIYCGACPSFKKSCLGCSSSKVNQRRKSKWACKVRSCCYDQMQSICADCDQFPCPAHRKKLLDSHPGDARFAYRHEIPENHRLMKELGLAAYLEFQARRWECPHCEGRVRFYAYTCDECCRPVHNKKL